MARTNQKEKEKKKIDGTQDQNDFFPVDKPLVLNEHSFLTVTLMHHFCHTLGNKVVVIIDT